MPDTIIRRVRTVFVASTKGLVGGMIHARRHAVRLHRSVRRLNATMGSGFLVGGIVTLGAGGALVKGLIGANQEIEDMETNLALLIRGADQAANGPFATFTKSIGLAREAVKALRAEAVSTPGTLRDTGRAFQRILVPGRLAGASYGELIKLASNVASQEVLNKGGAPGAIAFDVRQLLQGQGALNQIQHPLLQANASRIKGLVRGGNRREALTEITKLLELTLEERQAVQDTFTGTSATALDNFRKIAEIAGRPVFEGVKRHMQSFNRYVAESGETVEEMAHNFGKGVLRAVEGIVEGLMWIWENRDDLWMWAKRLFFFLAGAKVLGAVAGIFAGLSAIVTLAPVLGAALATALGPIGIAAAGVAGIVVAVHELINGPSANELAYRQGFGDAPTLLKFLENPLDPIGLGTFINQRQEARRNRQREREKAASNPFGAGLFDGAIPEVKIDARGSTLNVAVRLDRADPAQLASASVHTAFTAIIRRPTSSTFGLGSIPISNGR